MDYGQARGWVGRVVMIRRGDSIELDRLTSTNDTGLLLSFERGLSLTADQIDEMRPLLPNEAAQLIVDLNAKRGEPHDAARLTPFAGVLCALFPNDFRDGEREALRLLLTRTPSTSS